MSNHLKTAHEYGAQRALENAGYKSAAEVQRDAEALGLIPKTANLGAGVGGMGGAAAGGLGGAGLGALLGALAGNPMAGAALGGTAGLGLGSLAGSAYGGHRGSE